jgi:Phage gp6-like head-tail connector protein
VPGLVSLALAKQHLRITDDLHDADVQSKADQASAIVIDYLKRAADAPPWDETSVPPPVQAGVLLMLTHLYEHRGDDMAPSLRGDTPDADLWEALGRLLVRFRDPALK